jgi:hypothetical protein
VAVLRGRPIKRKAPRDDAVGMSLPSEQGTNLAHDVVRGLAVFAGHDFTAGRHTLRFAMSVWLRQQGTDPEVAVLALMRLRRRLVVAGGLDDAKEPIPLLPSDTRAALFNLGAYLHDLLHRAAASAGVAPTDLAEAVASSLT